MKRKDDESSDPVRTIRRPLCYTCGVAIDAPGDCAACLKRHEAKLEALLAHLRRKFKDRHPELFE